MSDAEWAVIEPLLPGPGWQRGQGGSPGMYCRRDIVNGIRYLTHNGPVWRAMPADLPHWRTVYHYVRAWLVGAHADRLFAVLLRLLGNRSEAEDVAQEVMLRACRGIGRFHGRSLFFTWLYRIAINEANRSLEKSSRRPMSVSIDAEVLQVPACARDDPSRRLEQTELRMALSKALAGLPPDYRTAIVLRDVEVLSTQQAAEIAGVGQAAFKSRLHQARRRVRAAIGDEALIDASR